LFCPGIGIALDSWLWVIALFVRPAVGSALVPALGVDTERASGTDVSRPPVGAGGVSTRGAVVIGAGGAGGFLPQALITSANNRRAPT
jgi:hypothetical protein